MSKLEINSPEALRAEGGYIHPFIDSNGLSIQFFVIKIDNAGRMWRSRLVGAHRHWGHFFPKLLLPFQNWSSHPPTFSSVKFPNRPLVMPMTNFNHAARRTRHAESKPQKAYTRAKYIRKRMGKVGSHPTHRCLYRNQSVARMRNAYGQVAYLKTPVIATGWAYALCIRMTGLS